MTHLRHSLGYEIKKSSTRSIVKMTKIDVHKVENYLTRVIIQEEETPSCSKWLVK